GQPISLNGWEMALNGVPKTNDTLTVEKTAYPAINNGNARALVDLRDVRMVGQQTLANGTIVPGATITDAYANALSDVGVRVQSAATAAQMSAAVAADAESAQASKSGVNLDEEAARLIQFQQSYQAAAKMLQVAQALFDTLLHTPAEAGCAAAAAGRSSAVAHAVPPACRASMTTSIPDPGEPT